MSLIAHYKLDGNANDSVGSNHGVGNFTAVDGKIGSAINMTANGTLTFDTTISKTYTISFWIKLKSEFTGSYRKFLQKSSNRSPGFWFHASSNRLHLRQVTSTNSNSGSDSSTSLVVGEWYHVSFSCNDKVNDSIRFETYINGTLDSSYNQSGTVSVSGDTISLLQQDCDIDDIRIYDHALSLKEVQELAKAKVLHYTFDEFQEPTENVIANTDLMIGWSTGYNKDILQNDIAPPQGIDSQVVSFVDSDGNGNGYWFSYGDYAPQQPNTTYTISVWARTVGSDWTIRAYTADNSETGRQYTEYKTVVGNGSWQRIVFNPITTPTDTQSDSLSFQFGTIPPNQRCWLCAPQMEAKDHATPFVNGTRTGVVRDSSGQDNDATLALATTPKWVSDSRLGGGAYEFDGSGTIDGLVQGQNFSVTESITDTRNHLNGCTYSFWLNIDTDAVDRQSLFFGSSTIRHIEIYSSGKYFRTEAGITNGYSFGSSAFPDSVRGEWAHFAIVFDTGTTDQPVRWYQNGKLFSTNQLGTDYFSFNRVGRSTGTTSYVYAKSLDGKMDDLRIYATALTDEQVLELYQTRASLDDKGNFYA